MQSLPSLYCRSWLSLDTQSCAACVISLHARKTPSAHRGD
jgi:hypothetical protein